MNAPGSDLRRLAGHGSGASSAVEAPRSRWKTRVLLPGLLLVIVLVVLAVTSARTLLPARPVRVVPVVVKTVEGAAGTVAVQAPGWLEPDPHPDYVAALAEGVVAEVLALEGDRVEAGQVVARLVDDDARLARQRAEAELERRRSQRDAARADLVAAELELEHLVERSRAVAIAEAVVAEARAEIDRVRAEGAVARARLSEIQDEYDRKSRLTESQAVSEAAVARLRLRRDAQRAAVEAVDAGRAVLEARQRQAEADLRAATIDRELLIQEHRAVALARAAVGSAQAAATLAEVARDEAALRLARMEVRAPVGGLVMRRLASPGSKLVHAGAEHSAHVVHLYDPAHLQVRVDVPLADAAHVAVGQGVEIIVEVLPDRTFTGSVTRLVHEADIQKNTVEVKVAVADPSPELKPDMLARVRFVGRAPSLDGTVRQRLFAPEPLVRGDGAGGAAALVVIDLVEGRGRVERRAVICGARRIDGWIEIDSGLRIGDVLIADPGAGVEPGDRVRVVGEASPGAGG